MGLLTKLKSLLGLEDDRSGVRRTDSGVTIEREPDESAEPNADVESAVKGVDAGADESFATGSGADATETGDAESAADAEATETGGVDGIEEVEETEVSEADAETDVSTEDVTSAPEEEGDETAETDQPTDEEPEPTTEETADEEPEEQVGEGEPLEDVKGIGPAYAERLRGAGVADVTELATADAERLAEETDLSAKRISTWIERANAR